MGMHMASFWFLDLCSPLQLQNLRHQAQARRWGLAFVLIGWLHLAVFSACYYLTFVQNYHGSAGYLLLWLGEILGVILILSACAYNAPPLPPTPLERFVKRVWISYFLLAFNLGTLNTLRGHTFFEFFPAMASLASFGFLIMTFVLGWQFFLAVLILFASGLLMAAFFLHAYLIFGLAWWLVLQGLGFSLRRDPHPFPARDSHACLTPVSQAK